MYCIAYVQ